MRSEGATLASSWPFSTRSTSEPVTRLASSPSCDFFAPFLLCEMWFIWTITYGPEVARAATPPPLQPANHTWKSRCFGSFRWLPVVSAFRRTNVSVVSAFRRTSSNYPVTKLTNYQIYGVTMTCDFAHG